MAGEFTPEPIRAGDVKVRAATEGDLDGLNDVYNEYRVKSISATNEANAGAVFAYTYTLEDKSVFTTPWSATMTYRSNGSDPLDWAEQTCAENFKWFPGRDSDVPRATKPDF